MRWRAGRKRKRPGILGVTIKIFNGAMYIIIKGTGYIGISARKVWWCLWDGAEWLRRRLKR